MARPTVSHSAGGVVINPEGLVLITNQRGRSWSLPKGHQEEGETLLETARREIDEETGVSELDLVKELGTYTRYKIGFPPQKEDKKELKHITLFYFKTTQMALQPKDPHNPEARWICRHRVSDYLTHPQDIAFFTDILVELE